MADTKKVKPEEEIVEATFPKLRGTKEQDILIIINGRPWQIQRGVKVQVPRYVLEAYDNSERSRDEAERYVMEKTSN